ncbi:DUF2637 domain-containing protein [Streptomyces ficellus]|uniref:DUF2637 domain-containing protein n=1 Tax=Streptomyces ficellus TaxID=1977088 RepID=A0A6I6FGL0_9ACTN|nr:DUF2637 domain-containing protein [Streptomyces ficellus]QGV79212.1 DUF2637 domain-containing protein [Streptomyces ficellus]
MQLTRTHRILIGVVITGAVIIAGIGFAGSYAAVRELAEKKGFGDFSLVFPIGIDAGICVLLALDLLLTWLRIPFPLLRQTAWLLTAATIAFNGAASWPDPLGVGMHAVIPVLFVVSVEAARHAIGRIADITADKHMEGVRLTRWLLSPVPTFRLWRRMKLWELRSYEQVIKLEQDRLIYQARLQARFGRAWRRKAPVEALMPLRLAKYGVPLAETAPAGLAAAGIEPVLLPPTPALVEKAAPEPALLQHRVPDGPDGTRGHDHPEPQALPEAPHTAEPQPQPPSPQGPDPQPLPEQPPAPEDVSVPEPEHQLPGNHVSPWFAAPQLPQDAYEQTGYEQRGYVPEDPAPGEALPSETLPGEALPGEADDPDAEEFSRLAYPVFRQYVDENNDWPSVDVLAIHLADGYDIRHPLSAVLLRRLLPDFKDRYQAELAAEHIA